MKIKIPKFLKKRRNQWIIGILAVIIIIGFFFFRGKGGVGLMQTGVASRQNLEETVLATGQVVSKVDLNLSFQGSGIVRSIYVKEGDKAYKGQILASLDQSSALATLTQAKGSLAQAQASYDKLVNGASQSDLQALANAVSSAKVNLNSAYNNSLSTLSSAYTTIYNTYIIVDNLQKNYFAGADTEGIRVQDAKNSVSSNMALAKTAVSSVTSTDSTDNSIANMITYLNNVYNSLQIIRDQCDVGVYYSKVPSADKTSLDTQKTSITTALSNVNTLQNSIASYKVALQTAQDNLSAKKEAPRQEDIDLANGQVLSAKGQVDAAQTALNNLIIIAPSAGTITQVDIKIGELATPSKEVMILQDVGDLHAEADISEANIASLQIGQTIDYTFDALDPDQHFTGKILTINPASTIISGVVDYKVTGSFENMPDVKPGMTANMTVLVASRQNVLAVPSTAVINKNGKKYVRVVDDIKKKTYHEVDVKTGLQADGGMVEILSGLSEGQEIVTYLK